MPTYVKDEGEAYDLAAGVMRRYHPELAEAGVSFGVLMASAAVNEKTGEPKGHAVTLHGYPCKATIKVNSTKDRVEGKPDVTLTIDADLWKDMPEEQRVSLLDHEWEHAVLLRDAEGNVKLDDALRPRVKLKNHDWQLGGFTSVCERHKGAAHEAQAFDELHRHLAQKVFPWG